MKKILVISYSQSGQTKEIVDNIAKPLLESTENEVYNYEIKLQQDFPFPWDSGTFYQAFPESFLQIPSEILAPPEEILATKFDLIILGYQVWYLTPSIPIVSFLKSQFAKQILANTPVITVVACRNMWATSHDKMKVLLESNGAKRVGNIALVDRTNNYISVVTIVQWLFSGKKEKRGCWPMPGVDNEEIVASSKFGVVIKKFLKQENYTNLQSDLLAIGAVEMKPFLITVDKTGNRIFKVWSSILIRQTGKKRANLLVVFKYYLLFAIYVASPIVQLILTLLYPLRLKVIRRNLTHYKGI